MCKTELCFLTIGKSDQSIVFLSSGHGLIYARLEVWWVCLFCIILWVCQMSAFQFILGKLYVSRNHHTRQLLILSTIFKNTSSSLSREYEGVFICSDFKEFYQFCCNKGCSSIAQLKPLKKLEFLNSFYKFLKSPVHRCIVLILESCFYY